MKKLRIKSFQIHSLRSFVVVVIVGVVVVTLALSGVFFFYRSADVLKNYYDRDIRLQFDQINTQIDDRVALIDNLFPLLISNLTIQENLEPTSEVYQSSSANERMMTIERQVTSIILSNYLWNQKFINSIFIEDIAGNTRLVSLKNQSGALSFMLEAAKAMSDDPVLQIITTSNRESSLYFARNIYSTYSGNHIASIIIEVDQDAWEKVYSENLDDQWLIYIFTESDQLLNKPSQSTYEDDIQALISEMPIDTGPQSKTFQKTNYKVATQTLPFSGLTSVIAVPSEYLYQELNNTLTGYIIMFAMMILMALFATAAISGLITAPIKNMITQIKSIASHESHGLVSKGMYSEFHDLSDTFNELLYELDIYYSELYEKQVLLKNAEIKALQAQMDPHFLFNVLDSIAWKASISDNDDIYQMVISLGELMRMNILAKDNEMVTLEQELNYIRFYLHLQQNRFEGKYETEIIVDEALLQYQIPCFSIQPLIENAIIHGLEPKKEGGKVSLTVAEKNDTLQIYVEDNGVGFDSFTTVNTIKPSSGERTHIGLKNLNRRLMLLYGSDCHLNISSVPNVSTVISFSIPARKEPSE